MCDSACRRECGQVRMMWVGADSRYADLERVNTVLLRRHAHGSALSTLHPAMAVEITQHATVGAAAAAR
jgi:hypothetical protein